MRNVGAVDAAKVFAGYAHESRESCACADEDSVKACLNNSSMVKSLPMRASVRNSTPKLLM
jgi:hypothetical protein